MDFRAFQLRVSGCWCNNPSEFASGRQTVHLGDDGQYANLGETLWCFIYAPKLTLVRADRLVADFSLAIPADAWYMGVLEHHVDDDVGGHHILHASVGALVGFGKPRDPSVVLTKLHGMFSWFGKNSTRVSVEVCPHWPGTVQSWSGEAFATLLDWVISKREWIDLAGDVESVDDLKRRVFSSCTVGEALGKQLGFDVSHFVCRWRQITGGELVESEEQADGTPWLEWCSTMSALRAKQPLNVVGSTVYADGG